MKFHIVVVKSVERNSLARTAHIPVTCKLELKTPGDEHLLCARHSFENATLLTFHSNKLILSNTPHCPSSKVIYAQIVKKHLTNLTPAPQTMSSSAWLP